HAGGEWREVEKADGVAELAERASAMPRHRIRAAGEWRDDEDVEPEATERGAAGDRFADGPERRAPQDGRGVRQDDRSDHVFHRDGDAAFEERAEIACGEGRPPDGAVGLDDDDRARPDGGQRLDVI